MVKPSDLPVSPVNGEEVTRLDEETESWIAAVDVVGNREARDGLRSRIRFLVAEARGDLCDVGCGIVHSMPCEQPLSSGGKCVRPFHHSGQCRRSSTPGGTDGR